MLTVDLTALLKRLNPLCSRALEGAAGLCMARGHYEVTVEHLLARLLDEAGGDLVAVLRDSSIDASPLKTGVVRVLDELPTGNGGGRSSPRFFWSGSRRGGSPPPST